MKLPLKGNLLLIIPPRNISHCQHVCVLLCKQGTLLCGVLRCFMESDNFFWKKIPLCLVFLSQNTRFRLKAKVILTFMSRDSSTAVFIFLLQVVLQRCIIIFTFPLHIWMKSTPACGHVIRMLFVIATSSWLLLFYSCFMIFNQLLRFYEVLLVSLVTDANIKPNALYCAFWN